MPRPRSRTEIKAEFIALRKSITRLQRVVDTSMRLVYKEAGWSRVHRRRNHRRAA